QIAQGKAKRCRIDEKRVRAWLGPRRFPGEVRKRTSDPGVATGLAVTAVGGDVLFIEATAYPGKRRLTITGQLGAVMQESATAAQRAGITRVVLPRENEPDLEELPAETRQAIQFVLADTIEEVLAAAFDGARGRRRPHSATPERKAAARSRAGATVSAPFGG